MLEILQKKSSMKVFCVINTFRIAFELKGSSLITCENSSTLGHLQLVLSSYLNLPSQKVTLSIIPYYFTTHSTSQNSIFSPILFKYSFLFFFYYFSFSIPFPLFLPQPLADQHRFQHRATHTQRPMIHRSTYPNPSPHTHTHKHR